VTNSIALARGRRQQADRVVLLSVAVAVLAENEDDAAAHDRRAIHHERRGGGDVGGCVARVVVLGARHDERGGSAPVMSSEAVASGRESPDSLTGRAVRPTRLTGDQAPLPPSIVAYPDNAQHTAEGNARVVPYEAEGLRLEHAADGGGEDLRGRHRTELCGEEDVEADVEAEAAGGTLGSMLEGLPTSRGMRAEVVVDFVVAFGFGALV